MRFRLLIAFIGVFALVGTLAASAAVQPSFMEDFEDGDVAGWSPAGANGIIEAVTEPVSPSGGDYVGKVTFAGSCYGPNYSFDPATPDYMSWYFRADGDTWHDGGLGLRIASLTGDMTHISYHQQALVYHPSPGFTYTPFMPASEDTWYLIELKNIDWDGNTFDLWVDGVERVAGATFVEDAAEVYHFSNFACGASDPTYLDDISFSSAPQAIDDCKKGGWQELTDHDGVPFKNQGDCVSYVATGGRNPGNG